MEQLSLVPNLNLRRLIKDLLNEGGEGLYAQELDGEMREMGARSSSEGELQGGQHEGDEEGSEYRFALVEEHILVLKVRAINTQFRTTGLQPCPVCTWYVERHSWCHGGHRFAQRGRGGSALHCI